jgi:FkbM family methyltransferase
MVTPDKLRGVFFYGTIEQNWLGHIMAEVYKDQIYRPYLPLDKKKTTAIDIGANIGMVSIYLSNYFEKVISLEPSFEHFDALNRNLEINEARNVKPINKALYIKNDNMPFGGPTDNKTMRSLHMGTWEKGKHNEMVQTITFDKLFEDEKIEHVDLMKIDCEGSEVEILSSPHFQKVASKIDLIIGEKHNWAGRNPNQMNDALRGAGFKLETIPNDAEIFCARKN